MSRWYGSSVFGIEALAKSGLALCVALVMSGTGYAQEAASPGDAPSTKAAPKENAAAKNPDETESSRENESSSRQGLLGDWRVGPTFQLGLPHPVNYGIDFLWKDRISGGFSTGKFEREIKDVTAQIANWDFRLRFHPFGGSFFLGAAYGQQKILARAEKDLEIKDSATGISYMVPTSVQVVLKNNYLTPHLGWFAVWDWGFTLGFELGAQIPMGVSTEKDIGLGNVSPTHKELVKQQKVYKDTEKDVDDAADLLGKTVLPYITLLRAGWLF